MIPAVFNASERDELDAGDDDDPAPSLSTAAPATASAIPAAVRQRGTSTPIHTASEAVKMGSDRFTIAAVVASVSCTPCRVSTTSLAER